MAPVEQFIWDNAAAPAETAGPEGDEFHNPEPAPEAADDDEAVTRIVVLSEDEEEEEETGDSWRRQLISALQDSDRDSLHAKTYPAEPPPIPPAEIPRRPPIALVASRAARTPAPLPVERRPRQRMGPVLFSISAMAGLLAAAVPRTANTPETAALAATSDTVITGSLTPTSGTDELKIVNSPVMVREVLSPGAKTTVPVGPVIETVRTVPIQIGSPPQAPVPTPETVAAIEPPAPPVTAPEPAQMPLPSSLDRDGVAALIANKPTAPAEAPAAVAAPAPASPAPVERKEKTASVAPEPDKPAKARTPQVSTAYQRSIREKPRAKSASKKRAPTKTASRSSDRAKWDTRRQGLRTSAASTEVKEVEPSTMVKLLKSLNPFGSKEQPQANSSAPAKNIFK